MPTLREISQSCGISVQFLPGDYDAVKAFLPGSPVPEGSYTIYGVARVDGKVIPSSFTRNWLRDKAKHRQVCRCFCIAIKSGERGMVPPVPAGPG